MKPIFEHGSDSEEFRADMLASFTSSWIVEQMEVHIAEIKESIKLRQVRLSGFLASDVYRLARELERRQLVASGRTAAASAPEGL